MRICNRIARLTRPGAAETLDALNALNLYVTNGDKDKLTFALNTLRKGADAIREDVFKESKMWRELLALESDKGLAQFDEGTDEDSEKEMDDNG